MRDSVYARQVKWKPCLTLDQAREHIHAKVLGAMDELLGEMGCEDWNELYGEVHSSLRIPTGTPPKQRELKHDVEASARRLFDNRWGDVEASPELWAELGAALYGEKDSRVLELKRVSGDGVTRTATEELALKLSVDFNRYIFRALSAAAVAAARGNG